MTSMCAHQFTRPAAVRSSSVNPSRNVTISVAMNSAMTTDSMETDAPSADRADEDAADRAARRCRARTAAANGTSASAVQRGTRWTP